MNYSDKHSILELGKKYNYGSKYIKKNLYKAKEMYLLAIKNKDYIAYNYLGKLYLDINNINKAIEVFHNGVEKGYFQCFINLGDIYFYKKDYFDLDLAEQYYNAALKYSTFEYSKIIAKDRIKTLNFEKEDEYYNYSLYFC